MPFLHFGRNDHTTGTAERLRGGAHARHVSCLATDAPLVPPRSRVHAATRHPRMEPVIILENLVKSFGSVQALRGLSLEMPPGPIGLLGPNGAGKTTLIQILLGLLQPDSGTATIAGFHPRNAKERLALRRHVGYMPEGDCLLPRMSAVETVSTLARITGMSWEDAMTRSHEVLDYVGLDESRYRDLTEYSTGMKQRLKLAQALVHDPQLLLLDEPTNGLDPKGRREFLDLVHDLGHEQGKNVLLCSHLLPDVERTCEYVIVIHHGRAVAQGSIDELTADEAGLVRVRVTNNESQEAEAPFERALRAAGRPFELEDNGSYKITLSDHEVQDTDELFAIAASAGTPVQAVSRMRSTLDDVFMRLLTEVEPD